MASERRRALTARPRGRFRRLVDFVDRHLWLALVAISLLLEVCQFFLNVAGISPSFLGNPSLDLRSRFYSTIASGAGSLLGLTLAAVAILVSFPLREEDDRGSMLAKGRRQLTTVIIALGAYLFLTLAFALVGIMVDIHPRGIPFIQATIFSLMVTDGIGIVITGVLFKLAVTA